MGPQATERQRRLAPRGQGDLRARGRVLDQVREDLDRGLRGQQLHVVQDEDEVAVAARQRVDGASQGRSQVLGVVVGAFQRDPREGPLVVLGPLEQRGRLPVPRRRHQEGDRDVADLHQPPDQAGARDEAAAEGGARRRGQHNELRRGGSGAGGGRGHGSRRAGLPRIAVRRAGPQGGTPPCLVGGHTWVHACLRRRAVLAGCRRHTPRRTRPQRPSQTSATSSTS